MVFGMCFAAFDEMVGLVDEMGANELLQRFYQILRLVDDIAAFYRKSNLVEPNPLRPILFFQVFHPLRNVGVLCQSHHRRRAAPPQPQPLHPRQQPPQHHARPAKRGHSGER